MKFISTLAITLLMGVGLATNAAAEEKIENRQAWLSQAVAMIQSGELEGLEDKMKSTLGDTMQSDVDGLMDPLMNVMEDHKPIYVDKVSHDTMGQTFDQHIYAAYYGHREFVFYAFTFAKLENGWQLYSLDFADSLGGLDPIN